MTKKYDIKEMVRDGKLVHFARYRKGELIYTTEDGFEFPVPIEDIGDGVFNVTERAMLLMRYIRKHIESIEKEQAAMA
jgi:hypothetical protein